jgi:hypothetical protein
VSAQDAIDNGLVNRGGQLEAILREAENAFLANPPHNALEAFDLLDRAAKNVDPGFAAGIPADGGPIVPGQDNILLNVGGIQTLLKGTGEIVVTNGNGDIIHHLIPPP